MTRKKISLIAFLTLFLMLGALIAGRMYLPYWVKDYVNARIAALDGYGGSVGDIDLHLFRGAYQIHNLNIYKTAGGIDKPFVSAGLVDLSVEWRALFNGAIVAEIDMHDAQLVFAKSQTGQGADWGEFIESLSPFDINHFQIHDGKVSYIDYGPTPDVQLFIDNIRANVTNLQNIRNKDSRLPSSLFVTGTSLGKGDLLIDGRLNILTKIPDFDLDIKLENANLPAFNNYARSLAAIDFETGTIGIYAELTAHQGTLNGYIKPIATNVSVLDIGGNDTNPVNVVWESIVAVFIEIFENQPQDQFAMRIPVSGSLDSPDQDSWAAFLSIFENTFQAFIKDTDHYMTPTARAGFDKK